MLHFYTTGSERMNLFHYNIYITCAHIGGLIQAEWHACIDKKYSSEDWMKVNR